MAHSTFRSGEPLDVSHVCRRRSRWRLSVFAVLAALPVAVRGQIDPIVSLLPWSPHEQTVRVPLKAYGAPCFEWRSQRPDLVRIEGLSDAGAQAAYPRSSGGAAPVAPCWSEVLISQVSPTPLEAKTWIFAKDPTSGLEWSSEVHVNRIARLQIDTPTRVVGVQAVETISVRAYDPEGNVFSSVEGVWFLWRSSDPRVLACASLQAEELISTPERDRLAAAGKSSDVTAVRGVESGKALVEVQLETAESLLAPAVAGRPLPSPSAAVEIRVMDPFVLEPSLLRLPPAAAAVAVRARFIRPSADRNRSLTWSVSDAAAAAIEGVGAAGAQLTLRGPGAPGRLTVVATDSRNEDNFAASEVEVEPIAYINYEVTLVEGGAELPALADGVAASAARARGDGLPGAAGTLVAKHTYAVTAALYAAGGVRLLVPANAKFDVDVGCAPGATPREGGGGEFGGCGPNVEIVSRVPPASFSAPDPGQGVSESGPSPGRFLVTVAAPLSLRLTVALRKTAAREGGERLINAELAESVFSASKTFAVVSPVQLLPAAAAAAAPSARALAGLTFISVNASWALAATGGSGRYRWEVSDPAVAAVAAAAGAGATAEVRGKRIGLVQVRVEDAAAAHNAAEAAVAVAAAARVTLDPPRLLLPVGEKIEVAVRAVPKVGGLTLPAALADLPAALEALGALVEEARGGEVGFFFAEYRRRFARQQRQQLEGAHFAACAPLLARAEAAAETAAGGANAPTSGGSESLRLLPPRPDRPFECGRVAVVFRAPGPFRVRLSPRGGGGSLRADVALRVLEPLRLVAGSPPAAGSPAVHTIAAGSAAEFAFAGGSFGTEFLETTAEFTAGSGRTAPAAGPIFRLLVRDGRGVVSCMRHATPAAGGGAAGGDAGFGDAPPTAVTLSHVIGVPGGRELPGGSHPGDAADGDSLFYAPLATRASAGARVRCVAPAAVRIRAPGASVEVPAASRELHVACTGAEHRLHADLLASDGAVILHHAGAAVAWEAAGAAWRIAGGGELAGAEIIVRAPEPAACDPRREIRVSASLAVPPGDGEALRADLTLRPAEPPAAAGLPAAFMDFPGLCREVAVAGGSPAVSLQAEPAGAGGTALRGETSGEGAYPVFVRERGEFEAGTSGRGREQAEGDGGKAPFLPACRAVVPAREGGKKFLLAAGGARSGARGGGASASVLRVVDPQLLSGFPQNQSYTVSFRKPVTVEVSHVFHTAVAPGALGAPAAGAQWTAGRQVERGAKIAIVFAVRDVAGRAFGAEEIYLAEPQLALAPEAAELSKEAADRLAAAADREPEAAGRSPESAKGSAESAERSLSEKGVFARGPGGGGEERLKEKSETSQIGMTADLAEKLAAKLPLPPDVAGSAAFLLIEAPPQTGTYAATLQFSCEGCLFPTGRTSIEVYEPFRFVPPELILFPGGQVFEVFVEGGPQAAERAGKGPDPPDTVSAEAWGGIEFSAHHSSPAHPTIRLEPLAAEKPGGSAGRRGGGRGVLVRSGARRGSAAVAADLARWGKNELYLPVTVSTPHRVEIRSAAAIRADSWTFLRLAVLNEKRVEFTPQALLDVDPAGPTMCRADWRSAGAGAADAAGAAGGAGGAAVLARSPAVAAIVARSARVETSQLTGVWAFVPGVGSGGPHRSVAAVSVTVTCRRRPGANGDAAFRFSGSASAALTVENLRPAALSAAAFALGAWAAPAYHRIPGSRTSIPDLLIRKPNVLRLLDAHGTFRLFLGCEIRDANLLGNDPDDELSLRFYGGVVEITRSVAATRRKSFRLAVECTDEGTEDFRAADYKVHFEKARFLYEYDVSSQSAIVPVDPRRGPELGADIEEFRNHTASQTAKSVKPAGPSAYSEDKIGKSSAKMSKDDAQKTFTIFVTNEHGDPLILPASIQPSVLIDRPSRVSILGLRSRGVWDGQEGTAYYGMQFSAVWHSYDRCVGVVISLFHTADALTHRLPENAVEEKERGSIVKRPGNAASLALRLCPQTPAASTTHVPPPAEGTRWADLIWGDPLINQMAVYAASFTSAWRQIGTATAVAFAGVLLYHCLGGSSPPPPVVNEDLTFPTSPPHLRSPNVVHPPIGGSEVRYRYPRERGTFRAFADTDRGGDDLSNTPGRRSVPSDIAW